MPGNRMVEKIIELNEMKRHPVEALVPQSSTVIPILSDIYPSGLINGVKEYVSEAMGLSYIDEVSWVTS